MEMGGFQDTGMASQWSRDSDVQAVGSRASDPNRSCAYLYLMANAEGPCFLIQIKLVTKTTTCAPSPPFLELKSMSFGSPCIIGHVSGSTRYCCWKHLEFSNTAGKRSRNHLWVWFGFSVSRGCRAGWQTSKQVEQVPTWWHLPSAS